MPGTGEVRYLVLAECGAPYLIARVRWPDVAQALSAASRDWIEDPGLFDLPYDPCAITVSFPQAAAVAAGWGARLHSDPGGGRRVRVHPAHAGELVRSLAVRAAHVGHRVRRRRAPRYPCGATAQGEDHRLLRGAGPDGGADALARTDGDAGAAAPMARGQRPRRLAGGEAS